MAPSQRVPPVDDGIASIPQLLEHLKIQTQLSDRAMAQYVGVAPNAIGIWRRGLRVPDPDSCRKVAAWAGLAPDYVLTLAGHRSGAADPGADPIIPEIRSILESFDADEQRMIALPLLEAAQRLRAGLPPPPPPPSTPPGPTPGTTPSETPR